MKITTIKAVGILAICAGAMAMALSSVAAAAPTVASRPATTFPSVGVIVQIDIPTATLFQCPAVNCNQGVANASWTANNVVHDVIAELCHIPNSTTPWGGNWDLVLDLSNNEVGWLSTTWVVDSGHGLNFTTCDGS